ncbi:MAG: methylamine utilization protein [Alphaproteobacteria bacterium]|nr:methylamine utilization protein [Alphaproteobacteria bacterium]
MQVRTSSGEPVANAIVTMTPATQPTGATKFPWPLQVGQRDLAFDPFVLIVPTGAKVAFPNFDTVRHHVYSFSPVRKFEIQLYGHDETRSVAFPTPGVVAIGCNIHDQMSAFIYVTDSPFAAKTDANGNATIAGVPAGMAKAEIWHPQATATGQRIEQALTVSAQAPTTLAVELDLRAQRRARHGAY